MSWRLYQFFTSPREPQRMPGWVLLPALAAAGLVLAIPLLLLTLAALLVGLLVLVPLALAARILGAAGRFRDMVGLRHDDGRRNVRVIRRE
jgi:hypothetical protein